MTQRYLKLDKTPKIHPRNTMEICLNNNSNICLCYKQTEIVFPIKLKEECAYVRECVRT